MYKNSYCLNETLFSIVDLVVVVVVAFVDWETFVALALVLVWSGWKDCIVSHRVTLSTLLVIVVVVVVVVVFVVVVVAVVVLSLVDLLVMPHFGCTYPCYPLHLQDIDNFLPPPMVVVAMKDIQKVDKVVVVMMVVIVMMVLIVPTRGQQRWWG